MTASSRVLLIDDDSLAHEVVGALLQEAESSVVLAGATSFDEGVGALLAGGVDVCLLDYRLGSRSGLDLLRTVQASGCKTPIVMLTAHSERELDLEAMKAGAVDFLVKGNFDGPFLDRVLRYSIERARTHERLRESEERYELAVNGSTDAIWDWKVGQSELFLSDQWSVMLGLADRPDHTLSAFMFRLHDDDRPRFQAELDATIRGTISRLEADVRVAHHNGSYRWVRLRGSTVRDAQGVATRIAGSLSDVTFARNRDPLTGLANRTLYLDRLQQALNRSRRDPQYTFAVLFIDCDRFKVVNDSLGHTAGDKLLKSIAQRLERSTRAIDTVARFGGDEFALLLDDARAPDGASRVAERIIEEIARPFQIEGREVFTGASIGIAMHNPSYKQPEEILRDADTAMYRAKAGGRGQVAMFDADMHRRALAVLELESELRRSIEANQLEVYFQPILKAQTRRVCGFEALVRWRHPTRGLIPPAEFLPLAEETGFILLLDRWVLERACQLAAGWPEPLTVSINGSRLLLDRPDVEAIIASALAASKLPPSRLSLEVTETVVMDRPQVVANLDALRRRGIQVAMDDFGTGYSSLANLHALPFTGLKIDRAFISQVTSSDRVREVVRAIIALGHGLSLRVTAEGVETEQQFELLKGLECDDVQGYLFCKPMPVDQVAAYISRVNQPSP